MWRDPERSAMAISELAYHSMRGVNSERQAPLKLSVKRFQKRSGSAFRVPLRVARIRNQQEAIE
jgi:hypothetical protein